MSTCRYGDGTLYGADGLTYGAATVARLMTWMFEVDWDNDSVYDGFNDGMNMTHPMEIEAGRQFFISSDEQGFEPVKPSKGTLTLLNLDGRYDPYNESGPLYGLLLPGRKFRLRGQREADGSREDVMEGRIADMRPNYGDVDTVRVELINAVKDLQKSNVRTDVQSTIRYDDAITAILNGFGWTGGMDIDATVSDAMPYWWGHGASAWSEILSVVDAALGMFCIAEDGSATYKSRVSAETPLMTITDDHIDWNYGIRLPLPWETIFNRIRVYARKRNPVTSVALWETTDTLLVPAGDSREIWADFSYNNEEAVATSLTDPVEDTDFDANSQSDGGGTDLSANITISVTKFASSAKLIVSNIGGTDAYMVPPAGQTFSIRLRGDAIAADKYTFVEKKNDESIENFGDRELLVKSDWLQDINTASDEAVILESRLSSQRPFPRFRFLRGSFDQQFGLRLFGLVAVNFARKGISGEFRIGYYKHRSIDEVLYVFDTEVFLEPNLLGNVSGTWVFPAVFGVTTVF